MFDSGDQARLHIRVRGRVQAVGFRAHVEDSARRLGIQGWVRNVGYDLVEAVALRRTAGLKTSAARTCAVLTEPR